MKILVQILLHSAPPVDLNRTGNARQNFFDSLIFLLSNSDLAHIQQIKSMGNRQTFHPNKLDYDVFNIEIEIAPVNLLLHGLFLKNLWWVKVCRSTINFCFLYRKTIFIF